jgi:hypothetical protein
MSNFSMTIIKYLRSSRSELFEFVKILISYNTQNSPAQNNDADERTYGEKSTSSDDEMLRYGMSLVINSGFPIQLMYANKESPALEDLIQVGINYSMDIDYDEELTSANR